MEVSLDQARELTAPVPELVIDVGDTAATREVGDMAVMDSTLVWDTAAESCSFYSAQSE